VLTRHIDRQTDGDSAITSTPSIKNCLRAYANHVAIIFFYFMGKLNHEYKF